MSETKPTTPDIAVDDRNQLYPLGYKIFLDRYALKDSTKQSLDVGDTVLVNTNLKTGQKEIGTVAHIDTNEKKATIKLEDGNIVKRAYEHVDKPLETRPSQMLDRVAKGVSSVEKTDELKKEWEEKFRWALDEWKFVPAGRILAAAGTDQDLTYYNCYVIPQPQDSREGIFRTLGQMAEIFSRGGGVGITVSSLRPRYAYVKGVNGRSSGSVSWASLYSFVTGLIEQGGSRRGALMIILNDWHPDLMEFITAKKTAGKIENANISVGVSDEFMKAVKDDADWQLEFPVTTHPQYNQEWNGILEDWKKKGYPTTIHKTIKAREAWDAIVDSAWASAEPGIWFRGRSNTASNSWYYEPLITTNPCGEQPLPAWSVCNLGAINLAKFVDSQGEVKWDDLRTVTRYATRFLDNVIDNSPYFFEENRKQQMSERRVGLNTMGLAEMMIKLKIKYGSKESLEFIDKLYEVIVHETYDTSSRLAQEKGSFKYFNAEKILQSGYLKTATKEVRTMISERGLRNVTLLTQAPNGTISTMVNTSGGIEPFFNWTYFRKSRLGLHEENVPIVQEYKNANPDSKELPDYFIHAMDLAPEDHIRVQAQIQKWVDSAISKTCNVPQEYTVEQVKNLFVLMHDLGCKGGTIYRDKSREEQILMNKDDERAHSEMKDNQDALTENNSYTVGGAMTLTDPDQIMRDRGHRLSGVTVKKDTPMGGAYITMNNDENQYPLEIFARVGKAGSDINAMTDAMGRLISVILRLTSPVSPKARVKEVVHQLRGIGGVESRGFGKNRILSIPDAVGIAMQEEYLQDPAQPSEQKLEVQTASLFGEQATAKEGGFKQADICPDCGNTTLIREEGCQKCNTCGFSKC